MRIDYPKPIALGQFMMVTSRSREPSRRRELRVGRSTVELKQTNSTNTQTCSLEHLELVAATGEKTQTDYTATHADIGPNDPRFAFAPGHETAELRWKLRNPQHVTKLVIEVIRRGHFAPVWRRTLTWTAGAAKAEDKTPFAGTLAEGDWSGKANPAVKDERLDGGAFTTDHYDVRLGPYMVRATVSSEVKGVEVVTTRRWVYFDVLVAEVKVTWGEDKWRVAPPPGVETQRLVWHSRAEAKLLRDMRQVGAPAEGTVFDLELSTNFFTKKGNAQGQDLPEARDLTDFEQFEKQWGEGPRVPLRAHVKVKAASGAAVDAPAALGTARVLWDWDDDQPTRWQQWADVSQPRSRKLLEEAVDHLVQDGMSPPSCNCPGVLGGKRGVPDAPVFPAHQAVFALQASIKPSRSRVWAAYSVFGAAGTPCEAAVVFNPARMAGERYRVRAIVEVTDLETTEALDVAPVLSAGAGTFVLKRTVDVHYLCMPGANPGITAPALQTGLETLFRDQVDVKVAVHTVAYNAQRYQRALARGIEQAFAEEGLLKVIEYGHLRLETMLDDAPANPTSAINYRTKNDYEAALRDALGTRALLVARVPPGLGRERITAGNKRVDVLWSTDQEPKNDSVRFLLVHPSSQGHPLTGELFTGLQSKASGALADVKTPATCWGFPSPVETQLNDPALEDAVRVRAGNQSALVRFKKVVGKLTTKPRSGDVALLETAILNAANALAPHAPLFVTIETKTSLTTRLQARIDAVKEVIKGLFTSLKIVDREAFFKSRDFYNILDSNTLKGTIPNNLNGFIIPCLAEEMLPQGEGVLVVHGEGETNAVMVGLLPNAKESRSSGTYYSKGFNDDRSRAVISFGSVADGAPYAHSSPTKDRAIVLAHEIGHSLFLPHAPSARIDGSWPAAVVVGCHVNRDPCVMNYDVDSEHLCALCRMRVRGWRWGVFTYNTDIAWEYNVKIELDTLDQLFQHPEGSRAGRMERLNVIGLMRRPLDHPEADACFDFSWDYALDLFPDLETPGRLDAIVADFLVDKGRLPAAGTAARIKVPFYPTVYSGSDYFRQVVGLFDDNVDNYRLEELSLQADPYAAMQYFHDANPAFGGIPIKITVRRRRVSVQTPWDQCELAPEASVALGLLPADATPGSESVSAHGFPGNSLAYYKEPGLPSLRAKPAAYFDQKVARYKTDEGGGGQNGNAHRDHGGRRGGAYELFWKKTPNGFQALPAYNAEAQHIDTDENGVARVVFRPSLVAGDRYKLRIRVAAPTWETDPFPQAVSGTMVRWRVVRVSRHFMMPTTGALPSWAADLPAQNLYACPHRGSTNTPATCEACLRRFGGTPKVDLAEVALEYARAGCLLVVDKGATAVKTLQAHAATFAEDVANVLEEIPSRNDPAFCSNGRSVSRETLVLRHDGETRIYHRANPTPLDYNHRVTVRTNGGGPEDLFFRLQGDAMINSGREGLAQAVYDPVSGQVEVHIRRDAPGLPPQLCSIVGKTDNYVDARKLLADVFPASSPALFNLALPPTYNANPPPDTNRLFAWQPTAQGVSLPGELAAFASDRDDYALVKSTMFLTLSRSIESNNNYMPGLMIVQASVLDNYYLIWPAGVQQGKGAAGMVLLCRPSEQSPITTKLVTHELGHVLYLMHGGATEPANRPQHDTQDVCVMDYESGIVQHDGDHCGQCVASLRGFAARGAHFNTVPQPPPPPAPNIPPPPNAVPPPNNAPPPQDQN